MFNEEGKKLKLYKEEQYLNSIEDKISLEDFIKEFISITKVIGKYRLHKIINKLCYDGKIINFDIGDYGIKDNAFKKTIQDLSLNYNILFECYGKQHLDQNIIYFQEYHIEKKISTKALKHIVISLSYLRKLKIDNILK